MLTRLFLVYWNPPLFVNSYYKRANYTCNKVIKQPVAFIFATLLLVLVYTFDVKIHSIKYKK